MSDDQYLTQTQVGQRYGNLSGKRIGKWLKDVGLRNADGSPTRKAIEGRYCKMLYDENRGNYTFWVWHAAKTLALLEESIQDPAGFAAAQRERAAAKDAGEEIEMDDEEIKGDE